MAHTLEELRALRGGTVTTPTSTPTPVATSPRVAQQDTPVADSGDLGRGKYFTGSGLAKFFDILQTPQYASAGLAHSLVKGENIFKGMKEGVQNRQSYSDVLGDMGVKNKYVKAIGGFAGDVLLDPTTYIGLGAVKGVLKKAPILGKGITKIDDAMKVKNLVKRFPLLQDVGGLVSNKFRVAGNTDYLKALDKFNVGKSAVMENAVDLGKNITRSPVDFTYGKYVIKKGDIFPEALQKRITQLLEGAGTGGPGGITMNEALAKLTDPIKEGFQKTGQELVRTKQAGKEVFEKYKGGYLPSYLKEKTEQIGKLNGNKLTTDRFKKRAVSTDWEKFVQNPGYRAGRGLAEEGQNVEIGKFFEQVNKNWAKDTAEKGFKQIPSSQSYGKLAGKHVPDYIYQDIVGMGGIRPGDAGNWGKFLKLYDKGTSMWKAGKTVLSPSQLTRNAISNPILNYMAGGPGTLKTAIPGWRSALTKDAVYQEAKKVGTFAGDFTKTDIQKLLPSQTTDGVLRKSLEKIKAGWNKAVDVGSAIQNKTEEAGKMAQFILQKSKGSTPEQARAMAEKALFNYGDLTPFEKNVIKRIIPFYTFTRKALPLVAETAVKHPNRLSVFKKGETAINNMTPERAGQNRMLPSYLKDAVRIPGTKNKYFNAQYIYPWGGMLGESNLPLGVNIPAYDMASKVISGYDPYYETTLTNSPLKEDMTKAKIDAVGRTLLPAAIAKNLPKPNTITAEKSLGDNLLGQFGLGVYNLDMAKATSQQEYQINDLKAKTTSQIKKAAMMTDKNARDKRIKRLQTNFQNEVKKIMGEL
jgi:hypothetical protein